MADDKPLTTKQLHFCRVLATGMTQAEAYREAFNCKPGSLKKTQQEAAARLMAIGKVRARVQALIEQRDRGVLASTLSDKDNVLKKLRAAMESSEGGPAAMAQLRAAELLGKSVGLFKDVVETSKRRSTEDIRGELQRMLDSMDSTSEDDNTDTHCIGDDDHLVH